MTDASQPPRCVLVLMCGMPGAGKTVLAQALAMHGMSRVCPDEEMFRRHGRRGRDFPRHQYPALERLILDDLANEVRELLIAGHDVVLDHGLWTPEERTEWRAIATEAGAEPVLVYMPVPHHVRWERIRARNKTPGEDAPSLFSEEDLIRYSSRFHPPGEGEPHLVYDGNPETILLARQSPPGGIGGSGPADGSSSQ